MVPTAPPGPAARPRAVGPQPAGERLNDLAVRTGPTCAGLDVPTVRREVTRLVCLGYVQIATALRLVVPEVARDRQDRPLADRPG